MQDLTNFNLIPETEYDWWIHTMTRDGRVSVSDWSLSSITLIILYYTWHLVLMCNNAMPLVAMFYFEGEGRYSLGLWSSPNSLIFFRAHSVRYSAGFTCTRGPLFHAYAVSSDGCPILLAWTLLLLKHVNMLYDH